MIKLDVYQWDMHEGYMYEWDMYEWEMDEWEMDECISRMNQLKYIKMCWLLYIDVYFTMWYELRSGITILHYNKLRYN